MTDPLDINANSCLEVLGVRILFLQPPQLISHITDGSLYGNEGTVLYFYNEMTQPVILQHELEQK